MAKLKNLNTTLGVVLTLLLLYVLYINSADDRANATVLKHELCHKELNMPDIDPVDKLIIEAICENYDKKKDMNVSKCSKILNEVGLGAIRGTLVGALMGGGLEGAVSSALTFGLVSGLSKGYSLSKENGHVLLKNKPI
jgi:hypothetical protein